MTKSKHTPGPWTYERDGDYCEITPAQIGGKDNFEGNETDYRLIAAAPDLLAVLIDLENWSDHLEHCNRTLGLAKGKCNCGLATVDERVRAVIAKATGAA